MILMSSCLWKLQVVQCTTRKLTWMRRSLNLLTSNWRLLQQSALREISIISYLLCLGHYNSAEISVFSLIYQTFKWTFRWKRLNRAVPILELCLFDWQEQAVSTFNFLCDEKRYVAGGFIPPTKIDEPEDEVYLDDPLNTPEKDMLTVMRQMKKLSSREMNKLPQSSDDNKPLWRLRIGWFIMTLQLPSTCCLIIIMTTLAVSAVGVVQ